jgi:glycosyltransferase involved in cell wall biosynthesis
MNKLLLVTDAWEPQVNGVVTTFQNTIREMEHMKWEVHIISPQNFRCIRLPFYKEISISLNLWKFPELFCRVDPTHIHIATEGPLGIAARRYCLQRGLQFTTSYHTDFASYANMWWGVAPDHIRKYLNWFHGPASVVLVPSRDAQNHLDCNTVVWGRGVDHNKFRKTQFTIRNTILCVSRVSKEKNLDEFIRIVPPEGMKKHLVGDGPHLLKLIDLDERTHNNTKFVGKKCGDALIAEYHQASVFVFPSLSDTFGIVMLEALASGAPVIAYHTGAAPDIIEHGVNGYLVHPTERLGDYIRPAMQLDREAVVRSAEKFSWVSTTQTFVNNLVHV